MSQEVDLENTAPEMGDETWLSPAAPPAEKTAFEPGIHTENVAEKFQVAHATQASNWLPVQGPPPYTDQLDSEENVRGPQVLDDRRDAFEQRIVGQLEALRDEFQHKIQYDRAKEKQVSELNRELQSYRSDLLANAMRPVIDDVIRLHRKIDKKVIALAVDGEANDVTEALIQTLIDIREDLELALDRQDIEVYRADGDLVDPRLQFVIRPIDTANPDLVGMIINRLAPGYRRGERIMEKERVAAYRFNTEAPFHLGAEPQFTAPTDEQSTDATTDRGPMYD